MSLSLTACKLLDMFVSVQGTLFDVKYLVTSLRSAGNFIANFLDSVAVKERF